MQWSLDVDLDRHETQLDVPGLAIDRINSRVLGYIDAVAAACHRLGKLTGQPENFEPPARYVPQEAFLDKRLRSYQEAGVAQLREMLQHEAGAILADDPGLGKSYQSIALAEALTKPVPTSRILIIAHSRWTFQDELVKWGVKVKDIAVLGPIATTKREWEKAKTARWVVTNAEMAPKAKAAAFSLDTPTVLILDEAHKWRDRKGIQQATLKGLRAETPFKLAMTGTPTNLTRDVWQLMDFVLPGRLGSPFQFESTYCDGHYDENNHWQNRGTTKERADELALRLSYYMLRRELSEVLSELPPLQRRMIQLDGDESGRAALQKAMTGAIHVSKALEATLKGKMPEAVDRAHEAKRFFLLTWRKDHAEQMAQMLRKDGTSCQFIHGDIPEKERQTRIKACEARGEGLVATLDSVGTGLNLQKIASYGIMHALHYDPQKMRQGEGRLYRMGQPGTVQWDWLVARGTADVLVVRTILPKLEAQARVLPGQSASKQLLTDLSDNAQESKRALHEIYEAMKVASEDEEDELWMSMG